MGFTRQLQPLPSLLKLSKMATTMTNMALSQASMAEFSGLKSQKAMPFAPKSKGFFQKVDDSLTASAVVGNKQVTECSAKQRVAINGFGRIGRNFLRCWYGRGDDTNLEVVCINDSGG